VAFWLKSEPDPTRLEMSPGSIVLKKAYGTKGSAPLYGDFSIYKLNVKITINLNLPVELQHNREYFLCMRMPQSVCESE